MSGEPGAGVLSIFDQMIDRIKQRTPINTSGAPIGSMVYSQLVLGMPICKADYAEPWSPIGSVSLQAAPPAPQALPDGTIPPATNERFVKAMAAAWKTSLLCRTMLQVTKDGAYHEYPTDRRLDISYDAVLHGMQPEAEVDVAPEVQARIDEANRVLKKVDAQGNITLIDSELFDEYTKNGQAFADAKAEFARQAALAARDPAKADAFPIVSGSLQQRVNAARNKLISNGAEKIERALNVIKSVGRPMQAQMIARARDEYDAWNMGISGIVPAKMPYSFILPSNWCDASNPEGFTKLEVDQAEVRHFSTATAVSENAQAWQRHADASSGGGVVSFGFMAFGGQHEETSDTGSFQNSSSFTFSNRFKNTAKNLHIEMEFGLCTIVRPWLVSDIFFLKNWSLTGAKKNSVSDGTIDGQADSMEKTLPMIPQQVLVVRNVIISSTDWGEDSDTLSEFYANSQGSFSAETSRSSGAAGVSLGFINFGGRAAHSSADSSAQSSSFAVASGGNNYGATFDSGVLRIPGAQIVAFLSDIVPACPDLDSKTLTA